MYVAMEPSEIAATGVCHSAHDLWLKIQENHEGASETLASTSLAEFLSLKYRRNESFKTFAGRYEIALGRVESTRASVDEQTKIWVLSNSLPDFMKVTVRMFRMSKPDGKASELISQLKIQHSLDLEEAGRQTTAYNAHETRHSKPDRFRSYHRPEQGTSQDVSQSKKSVTSCTYCKKVGHTWKECRKLKQKNSLRKDQDQPKRQQTKEESGAFMAVHSGVQHDGTIWIVDSGASSHMTANRAHLEKFESFEIPLAVTVGNGENLYAHGHGEFKFTSYRFTGMLTKVLWVPGLKENLFSVGKALELNCNVEFMHEEQMVQFHRDQRIVLEGHRKPGSNYFLLKLEPTTKKESALVGTSAEDWHRKLGHCSHKLLEAIKINEAVMGMTMTGKVQSSCEVCARTKISRASHPIKNRQNKANEQTASLHLDTVGPLKPSLSGSRYFLLGTEEHSGFKLIETVQSKNEISDKVKLMVNNVEVNSGKIVKSIMCDNGTEFTNHNLKNWLDNRGIVQNFSAAYTPEQNGKAERSNRSVIEGIRSLLEDSKLPEDMWAEAAHTVVYVTNRLPNTKDPTKTRYELLLKEKPNLSNLRIFGEKAIIKIPNQYVDGKLSAKGEPAIFVGYTRRFNTFRFLITEPYRQIKETCDVRFLDHTEGHTEDETNLTLLSESEDDDIDRRVVYSDESDNSDHDQTIGYQTANDGGNTAESEDETITEKLISTRRPFTRSQKNSGDGPAVVGVHENALVSLHNEPVTVHDAQQSESWNNWKEAMDDEMRALKKNNTWTLIDRPNKCRLIKTRWVFKIKPAQDGSVERFKDWLPKATVNSLTSITKRHTRQLRVW